MSSRPFEICQRWGAKAGDTHKLVFMKPGTSLQVIIHPIHLH